MLRLAIALGCTACMLTPSAAQSFFTVKSTPMIIDGTDFFINDFFVQSPANALEFQMLLELDQGTIYQNLFGGDVPPSSALVGAFPDVAFDTFVALDALVSGGPFGEPELMIGGAVDIGGQVVPSFNEDVLDIAWRRATGVFPGDNRLVARVTLPIDAVDELTLFGRFDDGTTASTCFLLPVTFFPCVPEPSNLVLITVCAVALGCWRGYGESRSQVP